MFVEDIASVVGLSQDPLLESSRLVSTELGFESESRTDVAHVWLIPRENRLDMMVTRLQNIQAILTLFQVNAMLRRD